MTRRELLQGTAGAAISLPLLASLGEKRALADAASPPKRAIFLYMPQNETEDFTPTMASGALSFAGTYLAALAPYAAKALHVSNLTGTSGHEGGHTEWLTGWPGSTGNFTPAKGPSLDQYIANRVGTATRLPTLGLTLAPSYMLGNGGEVVSWTAQGLPVPSLGSAHQAFTQLFPSANVMNAPTGKTQQQLQKSVLDALISDYARINATLGASDRVLLDAHLTQLRQLEMRLASSPSPAMCTTPAAPAESGNMYYPDLRKLVRDHTDVLVAALQCDLTRVATFAFGATGSEGPYDWDPVKVSYFHEVAHRDKAYTQDPRGDHFRVRSWYSQQVAYLLQRLDSIPEGTGTLLDHTLVAWLPELGYYPTTEGGSSPNSHLRDKISVLLFGGSGYFKRNAMIDAGQSHYHNLLLTFGQAMGYPDLKTFGAQGSTPIASLLA
jgi:hypothetical protein